jgi:V-type H+-transporting ATPase subunit H
LSKIRAIDKVRKEQRKQTIEDDLGTYRTLFLGGDGKPGVVESSASAKRSDVVQYFLVLLADLLEGWYLYQIYQTRCSDKFAGVPALSKAFAEHSDPYKPFLPLLTQSTDPEDPKPLLTSTVLTTLITNTPGISNKTEKALPKLFSYLSTLTKLSDGGLQDIAVLEYSALLRVKKCREIFWNQRNETVAPLVDILRGAAGVGTNGDSTTLWSGASSVRSFESSLGVGIGLQLLYHVLLVLWQLSFEGAEIGEGLEQ